jgi:hypothetical protein
MLRWCPSLKLMSRGVRISAAEDVSQKTTKKTAI